MRSSRRLLERVHILLPFSCLAVLSGFVIYLSTVELPNVEQLRVVLTLPSGSAIYFSLLTSESLFSKNMKKENSNVPGLSIACGKFMPCS